MDEVFQLTQKFLVKLREFNATLSQLSRNLDDKYENLSAQDREILLQYQVREVLEALSYYRKNSSVESEESITTYCRLLEEYLDE